MRYPVSRNKSFTERLIHEITTRLTMTSQYYNETGNPILNRSMSLKGEKSSMVVLWVEGSRYTIKGCSPQSGAKATTRS